MPETLKPGSKLRDEATGVEVILVKAPSEPGLGLRAGGSVGVGKRYTCGTCGAQALVAKAGAAEVVCHGEPMALAQAKPLPSSD
jgi:hypothetical protein